MAAEEEEEKRIFVDPEDGKEFTTRNLAKKHMQKKGHKGAVIVERVKEKPKKGKGKIVMSGKKGTTTRRLTKTQKKMNRAFQLFHQYVYDGDDIPAALTKVAEEVKEPKRKIIAWLQTMKGERKKFTPKDESKEKGEEEKEINLKEKPRTMFLWTRIFPQYAELIKPHLEKDMEIQINPYNQNIILKYLNTQSNIVDYWMFHYNFTSVELENSDILYILAQVSPTNNYKVWDTAQHRVWGLEDVSDEGCLHINKDNEISLSASVVMGRLGDAVQDDLACVAGIFIDDSKSLTSISDEHFQFGSEEEFIVHQPSHVSRWKPKPEPKFIKYPIYIMSEFIFGTNRLINYEIYE